MSDRSPIIGSSHCGFCKWPRSGHYETCPFNPANKMPADERFDAARYTGPTSHMDAYEEGFGRGYLRGHTDAMNTECPVCGGTNGRHNYLLDHDDE